MISCDRCGKSIGEPLDAQTYVVTCRRRDPQVHSAPPLAVHQLCTECAKVLRREIVRAIRTCLESAPPVNPVEQISSDGEHVEPIGAPWTG